MKADMFITKGKICHVRRICTIEDEFVTLKTICVVRGRWVDMEHWVR